MKYFKHLTPIAIIALIIAMELNYPFIKDDLKAIKLFLTFLSMCLLFFGILTLEKFYKA